MNTGVSKMVKQNVEYKNKVAEVGIAYLTFYHKK